MKEKDWEGARDTRQGNSQTVTGLATRLIAAKEDSKLNPGKHETSNEAFT